MKNCKTLPQDLFIKAVLLLFVSMGLFTTVQDAPASIAQITITSDAGSDDTYVLGDTIQATVKFNAGVNINTSNGTPYLTLKIGTTGRIAVFKHGKSQDKRVFEYTVAAGDTDTDGIEIEANILALNGGTITDVNTGKATDLKHAALNAQASHKVDTTAPEIVSNGVAFTSTTAPYTTDEVIQATVTFKENVTVTGTPQLALQIGSVTKKAGYASGSGTTALVFSYTVAAGDTDADGISIGANALSLNGGTIKDAAGNAATLTHTAVSAASAHKVDTQNPSIDNIAFKDAGPYIAGEVIATVVTFNEKVIVTGTPQLSLQIGSETKTVDYLADNGTALLFEYTVVVGDTDADGVSIAADALSLNGGTIKDAAGNAAALTHTAVSAASAHKVDTQNPSIDNIAFKDAGPYIAGEVIATVVTFNEKVIVTGTPQLSLQIGSVTKKAGYASGSGATALVFEYTVVVGDTDADGVSIAADALSLNSGTIKDAAENAATLTHTAVSDDSAHKVDTVKPSVNSIAFTSTTAPYMEREVIQATVTFSENVVVTGTPQLSLQIGSATKKANYASGSGTAALVFAYTVVAGDTDANGISIGANALSLNSGTIKDAAGNAATLTHTTGFDDSNHKVDAIAPSINSIAFTSTTAHYTTDEVIQATVTFSENVIVTGTPQLSLQIGGATKKAGYASGSGTAALVFEYTVATGDTDADGISIDANALSLNSGTIKDAPGNAATLTHTAVSDDSNHKVDTQNPSINNIAFISGEGPYRAGEVIQTTVTFNEKVIVTGTPQLSLQIGSATKKADYQRDDGNGTLLFEYTVVVGDTDADGISIGANALSLNSGTIKDAAENAATLTHTTVSDNASYKVDTTGPEIISNGVAFTSTTAHYTIDEVIQATVTFSENVIVRGRPQLTLQIGGATEKADYASGSGTAALVFAYTVAAGDTDADGISIGANVLSLNSGTIKDAAGNAATLTHTAVSADSAHQVDTKNPSIGNIAFTSTTAPYTVGEVVQTTVTFDERVFVTGTPQLTLQFKVTKKPAAYKSGSGTTALVFAYTVAAGDTDEDGISIDADALTLNGGTIKDAVGNNANLTHTAMLAQTAHIVDTEKPRINALRITSTPTNNTYKAGDSINVTVDWSKAVDVTGSPTIALSMEREIRTLSYKSGSGSKALVFSYTVTAGDTDETGVSIAAGQIELGTGVKIIQKGAATAAILSHSGLSDDASHKVDTTVPEIVASNGIAITSTTAPYTAGEVVQATVTFSDNVTVTGTPQLALQIGSATKNAGYVSGSGTTALLFEYTVVAADADADGISINADALSLNNGTIGNTAGNAATLTHTALRAQASHKVDGTAPTIATNGISITSTAPSNNTYTKGDAIQATVTFSENVDVTGTPQLTLKIGTADKNAAYTSGSGTTALVFEYTVVASDVDADGIEIRADKLALNGGTIKDAAGNAATLTYNALSAQASHKVDGTIPSINSIAITSTAPANNTYKTGDKIQATVTFTESMKVTGTPQLALQIGSATKTAGYASGTGTAALVFEYTVVAADAAPDGISIGANALSLNSGTIKDAAGNNAALSHTGVPTSASHKVDAVQPALSSIRITSSPGNDATYILGDVIQISMTMSEAVDVTGTPKLTLTIGTKNRRADYQSGGGTATLKFTYTVVAGDTDPDGISIPNVPFNLNGAVITDTVGNPFPTLNQLPITDQIAHKVDTDPPKIVSSSSDDQGPSGAVGFSRALNTEVISNGVKITSSGPYGTGDVVRVAVMFSENVRVTGAPEIQLQISGTTKKARYHSGSSTDKITFRYIVATGDSDTDGISIRADSIQLNGGSVTDIPGNPADLKHSEVSAKPLHIIDTTLLKISSLALSSTGPYKTSDTIEVTVTTTKRVTVTGDVTLKVMVGNTEKSARYHSGSGTNRLGFRYTVAAGDNDTNGVSVSLNSLSLNGGTIVDELGRDIDLNHDALLDAGDVHRVDTTLPRVNSVVFTSTGPYGVGNNIEITVTTSETVEVIGTPTLGITIGSTERTAGLFGGTGTSSLVFRYEVTAADEDDADGVSVTANSLTLNSGTITDAVGNALNLNHSGITNAGGTQIVRTTVPSIRSLAFTSTGPYGTSDRIEVTVTTIKPVIVTGGATLNVMIGHTEKSARYHVGSGTNTLIFQYTIASNDGDDTNGVSVRANSLALNGGTIVDEFGTALNLNHDALIDAGERQRVDTTLPKVSSLAFTSTGPYSAGSDILVTVTTSEAVTVAGRPTLTIVIGSTERTAHFFNNSSTTTLVFGYRVTASDQDDTNGVSVKANSLTLNGGTINDSVGNDLNLNHSGIANAGEAQIVGTTVSDIRSIAFTSTGPYAIDDTITVTVEATEKVTVTGIPRIPMTLGTATKYANYVSGSETTSLVFQYTVVAGDEDADGVEIAQNALENHNGSKIENSYQTDLNLNHRSVAADPKHKVDTTPPSVISVDFVGDAQAVYTAGSKIEVVVTFEETDVEVKSTTGTDMPSVTLLFGDNSAADSRKTKVEAYYTESRPGSTKLVFTYTVTSDTPIDTDGIQIESRSLKIPAGASIHDASGNPIRATQAADGSATVNIRVLRRTISRPVLPAVTSTSIIFNEFLNANTNKEDWVELRNITGNEISLDGWALNLSSTLSRGTDTFEFPDITLRAGAALLLMNTEHKETRLERSQAYTYRYLVVPKLHLQGTDFSLILRDRSGAVVDVVGNHFQDTETSDTPTRLFEQNEAYFREQPNTPGYEATAWQQSGYQGGLGYDRNTAKSESLGTPGYLKSAFTQQSQTVPVSISEIMFTAGESKRLPQWIELYNGSKTQVVTLQGWRLQVEVYDPNNKPTHRFVTLIIHNALRILPKQTVLLVTKGGRHSEHFPEQRIYNFMEQNSDKLEQLGPNAQLLGEVGYAVVLRDESGNQVDIVGNLDGERSTSDEPSWKLPNCIVRDGIRTSIIRQYEDDVPLTGTRKSSWFRAITTNRRIIIYWGHPKDIGYPGWKKGGALPVQLSSFRADRTEQGALIKWTTQSELENAGFNVLRSDTKTGTFKVVNPRMLQGAGTTSERHTYQYVDTTAKAGVAYYYRLEEISFAGVRQPVATRRLRGHVSAANRYLTTFGNIKKTE